MSVWPAAKAKRVLAALIRIGWSVADSKDFVWAFHDDVEIGPKMLSRIAKYTGLTPRDL